MTPAIKAAEKAKIPFRVHEYSHDPNAESYGLEAAEALGIAPARVFKTLLVELAGDGELAVGIVPVDAQLDLKAVASAAGVKKCRMADPAMAERVTGYIVGGISPLGQKKRLRTFLDRSASGFDTINVSAGRRGLEIELAAVDLLGLVNGAFADIARR
ncbi:MAG: Cys-tRNA(Pro) deacylase [Gammaproteobacteria bacterium]|jgi:Cys-tRNA(Pro)/Cys-tRNA(Cys) deacylase